MKKGKYIKLSVLYNVLTNGYAYCTKCKEAFIDDMPLYGSLLCPRTEMHASPFGLIRGLTETQIKIKLRKKRKGKQNETA